MPFVFQGRATPNNKPSANIHPCRLWHVMLLSVVWLWCSLQFQLLSNVFHTSIVTKNDNHGGTLAAGNHWENQSQKRNAINDKKSSGDSNVGPPNITVGCILVMDDNHRLVEWLAYHHFTIHLRYLIVAVDPRSTTSPQPILQRWTNHNNFSYQIWKDDDYMGSRVLEKRKRLFELGRKHLTMIHRVRQKAFYQYCLEHLDDIGFKTWTILLDVDEFLVINQETFQPRGVDHHSNIMSTPGGVLEYIHDMSSHTAGMHNTIDSSDNKKQYEQFATPCISIPRLLFGTTTDDASTQPNIHHPLPQLQDRLDTMRWMYHAHYSEFERNGLAKTMLDLSRIALPKPHFQNPVNPHRPFQDLCRDPKRILEINENALLKIHHYLGSWETYSYRNDSRKGAERSREAWEFRALFAKEGPNSDIVPWLQGFVEYYGTEHALQLLEGAGLPLSYTHPPRVDQQWEFLFKEDFLDQSKTSQYDSKFGLFLQNRTAQMNNKRP
jgi:hypothetical protein